MSAHRFHFAVILRYLLRSHPISSYSKQNMNEIEYIEYGAGSELGHVGESIEA